MLHNLIFWTAIPQMACLTYLYVLYNAKYPCTTEKDQSVRVAHEPKTHRHQKKFLRMLEGEDGY
jgi:hypothetical protein